MTAIETIHAGCVLVGEAGLLIRGPSGSGKSTLAREVIARASETGRFGRLVSDDRTRIEGRHGRLLARPVDPLGGCIEIHGLGIVRQSFEAAAVVRLVDRSVATTPTAIPKTATSILSYAASWSLAFACRPGQSRLTSPWAA